MDYGKLKTYYESIDGVTVPFVYPQYWDKDKEEWVVVDKDNRLPVDARLTGSIVEEIIYQKHIDIQPNSEVDIVNRFDLTGYRYIKYATWSMTHNDKIALRKRERVSEFVLSPFEEVLVVDDSLRSTEVMDIEGTQIDIKLVNKSDELITEIRVAVIGYKM